jgi:hypothetical protein
MDLEKFPNARCLDGSPAGFWFLPGHGSGSDKFLTHHQGGGWCFSIDECYWRSLTSVGSSSDWEKQSNCDTDPKGIPCSADGDGGFLSSDPRINPVAYNWNKAFMGYCDGGSFSGHVSQPVLANNGSTKLHFKGRYILDAVYDTLLDDYGMQNASAVIIAGSSAGGLTVYLHADYLNHKIASAALITGKNQSSPRITSFPDAAFFMDYPSIHGDYPFTLHVQNLFALHNFSTSVNSDCIQFYRSRGGEEWKCFFPQYLLPFMNSELFISNSMADIYQWKFIMGLSCDPKKFNCPRSEINYLNAFREYLLQNSSMNAFLENNPLAGAWLVECYVHSIGNDNYWWTGNVTVEGYSQGTVFQNWYERKNSSIHPWIAVDGVWGNNLCTKIENSSSESVSSHFILILCLSLLVLVVIFIVCISFAFQRGIPTVIVQRMKAIRSHPHSSQNRSSQPYNFIEEGPCINATSIESFD